MRIVARRDHGVYYQHTSVCGHRFANVAEYLLALVVVPVVDDVLEHVNVGFDRYRFDEIARDEFDAITYTIGIEHRRCAFEYGRYLEENASRIRIVLQYRSEQVAHATCYVGHAARTAEIVSRQYRRDRQMRKTGHCPVEKLAGRFVRLVKILKYRHTVNVFPRRFAGANAVEHVVDHTAVFRLADHQHHVTLAHG